MRAGSSPSGQASPEYAGLILVVALIAAAVAAMDLGPGLAAPVEAALCHAVGAHCPEAPVAAAYGPRLPMVDPKLTAAERRVLMDPDPQLAALELRPFTAAELAWLELNEPELHAAALRVESWAEQRDLLDAALDASLDDFQAVKDSPDHDPRMDYSDDGCSAPVGSSAPWFDFREACERHDFGYRNAKRLGLFDGYKRRIDAIFAMDMYDACREEAWWERKACRFMAGTYYSAVRVAGGHCELPGAGRVPGPCAREHG